MVDAHSVVSDAVMPLRTATDDPRYPNEEPKTVILIDPVETKLINLCVILPTPLKLGLSTEYTCVPLPDRSPAVITTRRVPRAPCPTMHLNDVSDSHSVLSHDVCAIRDDAVYAVKAIAAP